MERQSGSTVWIFKEIVRRNYAQVYHEIRKKILASGDVDVFLDPKNVTKQTLQMAFAKQYHLEEPHRFVPMTIRLADTVINKIKASKIMVEVKLFLEEVH